MAFRAGRIIREEFSNTEPPEWKDDNSPKTRCDQRVSDMVMQESHKLPYRNMWVVGEEDWRISEIALIALVSDPLDGSRPFMAGFPFSSFCVQVIKDGKAISAVIHDPFWNRLWKADKGKGAFLNGKRIHVSEKGMERSTHVLLPGPLGNLYAVGREIERSGGEWMKLWSVAMCGGLIAEGRLTSSIFGHQSCWETPAMKLIVEEAGGVATDLFGNDFNFEIYLDDGPHLSPINGHVISNGHVHNELLDMIARVTK